jgi:hypothetical protein
MCYKCKKTILLCINTINTVDRDFYLVNPDGFLLSIVHFQCSDINIIETSSTAWSFVGLWQRCHEDGFNRL